MPLTEKAIEELDNDFSRQLFAACARASLPEHLFHYTSPVGLLGMLSSHKVWATNLKCMNDFSEMNYAEDLIRRLINSRRPMYDSTAVTGFLDRLEARINPFAANHEYYAVCFCEHGDQLAQWREYAAKGGGFAVGFWTAQIGQFEGSAESDYSLTSIIYEPLVQEDLIGGLLDGACRLMLSSPGPPELEKRLLFQTQMRCSSLLPRFKNPAFREEREWRVICCLPTDLHERVNYRVQANTIVPYVELNLARVHRNEHSRSDRLPISRIVQGPQVDPGFGERSLAGCLRKMGYVNAKIERSVVPLRF